MVQVAAMEWFVKNAMATMVSYAPIGRFFCAPIRPMFCAPFFLRISDFLCKYFTWGS